MKIVVAKTAGFCFGVSKAINLVNDLLENKEGKIYTLGPIIHNEQMVEHLRSRGVTVVDDVKDTDAAGHIVIRAHGVMPNIYEDIRKEGLILWDATCPYVKKIHGLVKEKFDEGYQIIIIGDANHPEVKGINGWCNNTACVVNSANDVELLPEINARCCVVAQTTITYEKWQTINSLLKSRLSDVIEYDTICHATNMRQREAAKIAEMVDMMIVIGSNTSSNTQKLFEICKKKCNNTYKIQKYGDISSIDIKKINKIGITAGASTPEWVIKEVTNKMSELNKQEKEMSFQEAIEESIVMLKSGEITKGKILSFNNSEVFVDLGYKSDGMIPIEEFKDDVDFEPEKDLVIGEEIEAYIIRVNDVEGYVLLSKKKVDAMKSRKNIEKAFKNKETVKARVTEVIKGGLIASCDGIKIFVPASQISDKYIKDLKQFLNTSVNLRIMEYNRYKNKMVGSQRVLLEEEKKRMEDELWNGIEVGRTFNGIVKSITNFGAFVDIGGVDGLVHISEMSWSRIKHPSELFNVGDKAEVRVLEFDRENRKISLGFRKIEDNPWNKVGEKFKVGDIVKGKVVRLVPFGVFVELDEGLDGLVHISQISNVRISRPEDVLKKGQEVEVKITEINNELQKIGLSIKEVNPIDPPAKKEEKNSSIEVEEQLPSEHKEEMPVKIGDLVRELEVNEQKD